MHSGTQNNYIILYNELQNNLSKDYRKHGVIYQGKYKKGASKIK